MDIKINISFIMPVYNAEKYLSETIESLLNQSSQEFELIAINDGSTDHSLDILQKYAKKDKRIIVIDKENCGVSKTRNKGISLARGKYISFLDADDLLHKDYLKILMSIAYKHNADLVVCDNQVFYHKYDQLLVNKIHTSEVIDLSQIYKSSAFSYSMKLGIGIPIGNKIYRKSCICDNNIIFDSKMTYGEDMFFNWKVFLSSEKIIYIKAKLYLYRQTSESATTKHHEKLFEKYKNAFLELKNFASNYGKLDDKLEFDINYYFVKRFPSFLRMTIRENKSIRSKIIRTKHILSNQIIETYLQKQFNELIRDEDMLNYKLYYYAKKSNYMKLILFGYFIEYRQRVSRFIKIKLNLQGGI